MIDTLLTHLQLFGIGFSFGIAGPCFLTCAPVIITYVVGNSPGRGGKLKKVVTFLAGRFSAYLLLGILAGLSSDILRSFLSSEASAFLKPAAGALSILLGVITMTSRPHVDQCGCGIKKHERYGMAGLFAMGFTVGVSPCAPLLALLFDITLLAKGWAGGLFYSFSFGLGTFLSGLLMVGAITGVLAAAVGKTLRSNPVISIFRTACGLILIALGVGILMRS
jgi:hypothetical protein